MRAFSLASVFFLFLLSIGARVEAQTISTTVTSNLSLGSSGAQVVALQQILNQNVATQIASIGPGSPGNESGYFGTLTRAAVIRFQQKYADQILTPAGLTQGNGFVGSYTRAMLNAVSVIAISKTGVNTGPAPAQVSTTPQPTASAPNTSQNPNMQNAPQFLSLIDSVGTQQGLSSSTLNTINQSVLQQLATTTDLQAAFPKTGTYIDQPEPWNERISSEQVARNLGEYI